MRVIKADSWGLAVCQGQPVGRMEFSPAGEAAEWLDIAQAYAGPPGQGRAPGQFTAGELSQ